MDTVSTSIRHATDYTNQRLSLQKCRNFCLLWTRESATCWLKNHLMISILKVYDYTCTHDYVFMQPSDFQRSRRISTVLGPESFVEVIFDLFEVRHLISNISRTCFFVLRRLLSISQQPGRDVTERLVSAFVLTRFDYCNAMLAGLLDASLVPLQQVLNASAQLIFNLKPRDHITSALQELHWLPIR